MILGGGNWVLLQDDFTGGLGISAGASGETGWSIRSTADAGHLTDPIAGEANHPGIYKISCAPIANSILSLCRGHDSTSALVNPLIVSDIREARFVVRPLSSTNVRYLVGFAQDPRGATSNVLNGGTAGVYAFYDLAVSANWLLRTRNASTNTNTDTGVPIINNRWYEMRFTRNPNSSWQLEIGANGVISEPVTNSANIPNTAAVSPTVTVQSTAGSDRVIHFDLYEQVTSSLVRF